MAMPTAIPVIAAIVAMAIAPFPEVAMTTIVAMTPILSELDAARGLAQTSDVAGRGRCGGGGASNSRSKGHEPNHDETLHM